MSLLDPYSDIDTIDSSVNMAYNTTTTLNPPAASVVNLRIGSLNCRGLTKTAATSTRGHFIRYLRTRHIPPAISGQIQHLVSTLRAGLVLT
ncbi:hypothetical protein [Parasitella parasitica]|uniref:Uncharacterized protein n=1 Tax=Parasitella parasitica TaxID=35722 RepID=A0A0B7N1D8_9FUNG|nr:hypothetical protein [Parasitella parasitica]